MVESQPPNNPVPDPSSFRGTFVGRQREMGEMEAALDDALSGRGRLVMLAGEPGIGKTRTAQEVATYAEEKGARVLWGWCYEEEGAPFHTHSSYERRPGIDCAGLAPRAWASIACYISSPRTTGDLSVADCEFCA